MSTPVKHARNAAAIEREASLRYVASCKALAEALDDLYAHIDVCICNDLDRYEKGEPFLGDCGIEHARRQHRVDLAERDGRTTSDALNAAVRVRTAAFAALPWPKP